MSSWDKFGEVDLYMLVAEDRSRTRYSLLLGGGNGLAYDIYTCELLYTFE